MEEFAKERVTPAQVAKSESVERLVVEEAEQEIDKRIVRTLLMQVTAINGAEV